MNAHFRKPLKLTGIAFGVGLLVVIGGLVWVLSSDLSTRKKNEIASLMGAGLGVGISLLVMPFWLSAAAKIGKEKRAKKEGEGEK